MHKIPSTLLSNKKIQIKTIMGYHYTPIKWLKLKKNRASIKCGDDTEQVQLSNIAGENAKSYICSGKQIGSF